MGRKICDLILGADDLQLVARVDTRFADGERAPGALVDEVVTPRLDDCPSADLIVDFSSDAGAHAAASRAKEQRTPLLIATTALSDRTHDAIEEVAAVAPVLVAANTSIGANVLAALVSQAARAVGVEADLSLVEAHHRHKKDAPSGTALLLAQLVREAGGELADEQILSVRGGDVPGEHTLRLAWAGELIELRHVVTSRDIFAAGALRAGRWLVDQRPGRYGMNEVLSAGP
jgi:4-hydroxy-tetrahydrodipicolinate reductase